MTVGSAVTTGATSAGGGDVAGVGRGAAGPLGARRGLLTADAGVVAMTRTSGSWVAVSGAGDCCASTAPGNISANRLTAEIDPRTIADCRNKPTPQRITTGPHFCRSIVDSSGPDVSAG